MYVYLFLMDYLLVYDDETEHLALFFEALEEYYILLLKIHTYLLCEM